MHIAFYGFLQPCTPYLSGRFKHVCFRLESWQRMCTGPWNCSKAMSQNGAGDDKVCLQQKPDALVSASLSFSRQPQHTRDEQSPKPDGMVASLLDMGFCEAQITQLLGLQAAVSPGLRQSLTVVSALILLGLNPGTVLKVLQKSPELQKVPAEQLKDRTEYLRRIGLGEGSLQRVVSQCPGLLCVPRKHASAVVHCLKEDCLFSTQQMIELLRTCPSILQQQPEEIKYKFQYAYFCLGIQQQQAVKTRLFQFPISELKYRHSFLQRLGLYQTPDKKGQTQICNPRLKEVLVVSNDVFLAKVAHSTSEEFQIFKKLLDREEKEEEEEEEE